MDFNPNKLLAIGAIVFTVGVLGFIVYNNVSGDVGQATFVNDELLRP